MAIEHTATPWHVEGGSIWAEAGDGSNLRIAQPWAVLNYVSMAERNANAAFIVKAVNSHDALVAALEAVRDEFDARYDGAPDSRVLWMGPLMREIDAALKLAGEPEESEDL